jgi:hypothetical protein
MEQTGNSGGSPAQSDSSFKKNSVLPQDPTFVVDEEDEDLVEPSETEEEAKANVDKKIGNCVNRLKDRIKAINYTNGFKEWTRRIYRMILIFGLLGFAVFAMWFYVGETSVQETTTFSGGSLTIEVSGCRVRLYKKSGSDVKAYVNSQIKPMKPDSLWN